MGLIRIIKILRIRCYNEVKEGLSIKYYFASRENYDGKTLEPRIPIHKYNTEDSVTDRICVSQSINGCLTAIGSRFELGTKVYIHECESDNVVQPTEDQVCDVQFTGEQWILEPVVMKLYAKVIIIGTLNSTIKGICNVLYAFRLEYDEYDLMEAAKSADDKENRKE